MPPLSKVCPLLYTTTLHSLLPMPLLVSYPMYLYQLLSQEFFRKLRVAVDKAKHIKFSDITDPLLHLEI